MQRNGGVREDAVHIERSSIIDALPDAKIRRSQSQKREGKA
jgi:hypothetical protein